ncbi:MAG: MobV family relaxase [Scytonema sp. PMC 1069.18]|nr:MobV family relaxase [Scytonema sp. PMC 1069.18]MEC4881769.1 MobV family relaxase [Scytonema sp. PMC 1070.18]
MAALAILRVEKLKSFGSVGGSEKHTARLQDTPNADPTKTNIRLIGNPLDPPLEKLVQAKIASDCKHKPRKDAVLCSEIFLSASPEYFRPHDPSRAGEWDDQLMWDFANASRQWLLDNYGDKCVRAELHLDEATPHIHAYVVPVNQKTKLLSHKAMFGGNGNEGKQKLSKLQDSYALALAHLGIERGVKGSKATHTKVKEYYTAVNSNPLLMELDRLAPQPGETAQQLFFRIKADPQIQTINHQLADRQRALSAEKQAKKTAQASEKLRQQLEQENQQLRQLADQLRDLPLEEVAWQLGLTQDAKGDGRWKGEGHIINIDEPKWYDFSPSSPKGGGGAIDLVMYVNSCSFPHALAWLNDSFGEEGMLKAVTHHAREQAQQIAQTELTPQFTPPPVDSSQWPAVERYLTQQRGLPKEMVQALHNIGLVYADSNQNAVFRMRSLTGETTGAFLRGTRGEDNTFMGYARGTKRADGWFYLRLGGELHDDIQRVVLTKSPIDAVSLATIEGIPQQRTMYLVADSAKSLPVEYLRTIPTVIAAYDNDASGFELDRAIALQLPSSHRVRPALKDWNEELLARLRQNQLQKQRLIER